MHIISEEINVGVNVNVFSHCGMSWHHNAGYYRHKVHCTELRLHSSGYRCSQTLAVGGQRECIDWDYGGAVGKGSSECFLFSLSPLRPPHLFWEQQAEIWSNAECHMCVFVRETQHFDESLLGMWVCMSNQPILCVCVHVLTSRGNVGVQGLDISVRVCSVSAHSPSSLKGCLGYSVQVLLRGGGEFLGSFIQR